MDEIEVSQILLQLPRLIAESEVLRKLPLSWGSKKKRTVFDHTVLLGFDGKEERFRFCDVEEEAPKKVVLPHHNIPLIEEGSGHVTHTFDDFITSKKAMAAEARSSTKRSVKGKEKCKIPRP